MIHAVALAVLLGTAAVSDPAGSATTETTYKVRVRAVERQRRDLATAYRRATTLKAKRAVLERARRKVLAAVTADLAPVWYGTPWRFSGRTAVPQRDAIACGTFVATLLRDAGFRLNRIRMGRLASEHIALSLTSNRNVRRYSNKPGERVAADVEGWGEGLYLLGLDYHAALIHVDGRSRARIIHSSYYQDKVASEPIRVERAFLESRYRVVAKLLDDRMIEAWLTGRTFQAKAGS